MESGLIGHIDDTPALSQHSILNFSITFDTMDANNKTSENLSHYFVTRYDKVENLSLLKIQLGKI